MRRSGPRDPATKGFIGEGGFWIFAVLVIATPMVLVVLYRGVTPSSRTDRLHDALYRGRIDELARLLPDDQPLTPDDCQLLPEAASYGHPEVVRLLLERGIDADTVQTSSGGTPLLFAAYRSDAGMVQALLKHGADANRQPGGQYPLIAAAGGDERVVRLLLNAGARVNAANRRGQTPLMVAAASASPGTLKLLIASGARVNARDNEQLTPLMLAASANQADTVAVLLQAGADATLRDHRGRTAADRAELAGHAGIVRQLGGR